jgi:hypothetical protein
MEITKLFTQLDRLHFDGKLDAAGFKAFAKILYPIRPEYTLEDDGRISVCAVPSSGGISGLCFAPLKMIVVDITLSKERMKEALLRHMTQSSLRVRRTLVAHHRDIEL